MCLFVTLNHFLLSIKDTDSMHGLCSETACVLQSVHLWRLWYFAKNKIVRLQEAFEGWQEGCTLASKTQRSTAYKTGVGAWFCLSKAWTVEVCADQSRIIMNVLELFRVKANFEVQGIKINQLENSIMAPFQVLWVDQVRRTVSQIWSSCNFHEKKKKTHSGCFIRINAAALGRENWI